MKIEVVRPCFVNSTARQAGEVVEVSEHDGYLLIGMRKAKKFIPPPTDPEPEGDQKKPGRKKKED